MKALDLQFKVLIYIFSINICTLKIWAEHVEKLHTPSFEIGWKKIMRATVYIFDWFSVFIIMQLNFKISTHYGVRNMAGMTSSKGKNLKKDVKNIRGMTVT